MSDWLDREELLHALSTEGAVGLPSIYKVRSAADRCGSLEWSASQHKTYAGALREAWKKIWLGYLGVEIIDMSSGQSVEIPMMEEDPECEESDFDREPEEIWLESGRDRNRR